MNITAIGKLVHGAALGALYHIVADMRDDELKFDHLIMRLVFAQSSNAITFHHFDLHERFLSFKRRRQEPRTGKSGSGKLLDATAMYDFILSWMQEEAIGRHLATLAFAYFLALPIGWNREEKSRSAGLRTFPLVAVASCGFVEAVEQTAAGSPEALARVVEGVITGMGFIGGGAILKTQSDVHGTATAAGLWATGAIGIASALGAYHVAVTISLVTFLTLSILSRAKP